LPPPPSAILDCNGAPLDPAESVLSQAEDVAARREPGCRQLARRLCACPQRNFFGSEFSAHTNGVIGFIFGLVLF